MYDSGKLAQESISNIADRIGEVSSSAVVAAEKLKTGKIEIGEFMNIANKGGSSLGIFANAIKNIGMNMLIMATVSAAFWAVGQVIDNVVHKTEKLKKASEEAAKSIQEIKDTYTEHTKLLKEVSESYNDLASGVDTKTNKNLTLSSDDYNKFLDINNQLAKSFPQLVDTIDNNGNAIINLGNNSQESAAKIRELLQAEQNTQNYKIFQNIDDLYGGVKVQFEEAKKAAEDYEVVVNSTKESLSQVKDLSESGITIGDKIEFSGSYGNSVDLQKLQSYKNVVQEFYKSLDKDRQTALNIDGSFLPSTMVNQDALDDSKFDFYLNTVLLTDEEKEKLQNMIQSEVGSLWAKATDSFDTMNMEKSDAQTAAELKWKDFIPNLVSAMKSQASYKSLDDTSKEITESLISGLSMDDVYEYTESTGKTVYDYVVENIITPLSKLPNDKKYAAEKIYHDLFALKDEDLSPTEAKEKIDAYINQLAEYLKIDSAKLKIQLGFGSTDDLASKYQQTLLSTVNQFKGDAGTADWDKWFKYAGINTEEEIDNWNKIAESCKTAAEAKKKYLDETSGFSDPLSKEDMISEINGLSEGFEELDKIMTSMKDKDKKFDYSLLVDKKFKDNFGGLTTEYNAFMDAVTNSPKDVAACQSAFNDLASAFIYNSKVIKGLSDDNADVAAQYLELMGVQNAEEVVTSALAQRHADAAWEARDLSNATYDEIVALAQESESTAGGQKAFELYLAQKILANQTPYDASASINNLKAIVGALGIASSAWVRYYAAVNRMNEIQADPNYVSYDDFGNKVSKDTVIKQYADIASQAQEELKGEIDAQLKNVQVSNYTGPKSTNPQKGSSGSKGAKDNSTIDWIKRSAELLERESTRLQTAIDDTWKAYTGLSQADIERVQELFSMNLTPNSDEVNELLDYADKLGVSIGELQDLANNNGLESRQSLLEQLIDVDKQRLDQGIDSLNYYKNSYEEYVAKVPEYRDKIENGGIDIESFSGDEKTKIENAMNAYDSYLDQKKTNLELSNTIRDNELEYYTIAINEIDKKNARLSSSNDLIQKQIDLLNTQGITVSSSMYDQLISNTEGQIGYQQEKLQKQKDQLIKAITEEGLKVGSDKWYELNDEIMSTEGSIKDLEKAQAEYEKQLRELPITNLEKLGTIYQNILDTIQNWGAEMEASGKTLDADYYQKLINNANTSISNYKEEIEAIQDVMEDYNPGTDNWNEMNDKLQQCNSSISSLVQNMHKWNEELLNLPIQKISDASDSLSKIVDGLNDVKSEHETVISAVTGAISDEIDRLNDEKEAYEDTINDQKEALQDRMDLLDKQNEKLKLQAQYEQALYDLENATTQKTEKVIRNGELTYEANADNLRNAQESVQDALAALKKQELQDQMDALDDALDDYNDKLQDTLDSLQKISDKWSEIASKKEQADNEKTATDILGKNWKDKVLSGNDADIFQMFSKLYSDNVDQINKYQEQIDSTEHISSLIQEYIDSYKAGTLTYEEAQAGIHDLVSQMNQKMSAMDNLQNIYNYMGKVYDTAADGDAVFGGIQKAFKESGDQLISSLQQYQANAGLISESMSSWQQLTNNVESIKDILEDVKDNLKDTERDRDDDDSGSKKHSSSSNAPSTSSRRETGDSSHGPGVEKHHSGVFSGAVGSSSADKTDKIRVLEAEKLGPNEIPAVLERGEMVFTPEQMEKLVASFSATAYVPDNSWIKNMYPSATVNTKPNIVNVSVGDVKLTDVRDVDGFAKAMGKDFVPLARQALARF